MKLPRSPRPGQPGYVSYVMVIVTGGLLTMLTLSAYKRAASSQTVQSETQLRIDYSEKEEEVVRALVNIVPNRAIRAMQSGSNQNNASRTALRWNTILSDALTQANARTSVSADLVQSVGGQGAIVANVGDDPISTTAKVFSGITWDTQAADVSSGLNRSLGNGFPAPLQSGISDVTTRDRMYPIISDDKIYGGLASYAVQLPVATYPRWNRIPYPDIRFGYCAPGQMFVAKRNWWAFSMSLGQNNNLLASYGREEGAAAKREYILSLYEIPSQLAISAEAFAQLGTHADGTPWQRASIEGGVFATRAEVDSGMHVDRLMARRGLELHGGVSIGNDAISGDPLAPGTREQFEVSTGKYMPVAIASDSGRAAFVPINRGAEFFDRFAHATESNVLSTTTWNNYSVGALQCAMRLDVVGVTSPTNRTPSALRFQYFKGGTRQTLNISLNTSSGALQSGYIRVADENQSYNFGSRIVDVAYGANNSYYYKSGVTGTINFNNATFGDPLVGTVKGGFFRPTYPFEVKMLHGSRPSIAVYPERFPEFLAAIGGDNVSVNHSLVVNVDYSNTGLNNPAYRPNIPCTDNDYAVLMSECDDLRPFTKGFSLVTNLRLYIGDDFNVVATTVPAGSNLPAPFYPPASLFAPEKRYGTEHDPFKVQVAGQIGHLKGDDGSGTNPVHLLDFKMGSSESTAAASKIDVNLRPITHPAELPPVTMMNWLIVVEERRKMFYSGTGAQ